MRVAARKFVVLRTNRAALSTSAANSWAGRQITVDEKHEYRRNGIFVAKQFFSQEETAILEEAAHDPSLDDMQFRLPDGTGKTANLTIWNTAGDDSFGYAMRRERMVSVAESLLCETTADGQRLPDGDEAYFYHGKLNKKAAQEGGSFIWHQDYGYWYNNGILYPNMLSGKEDLPLRARSRLRYFVGICLGFLFSLTLTHRS